MIKIIKPRRIHWAEYVAGMGEKKNEYKLAVRKPEGRMRLRSLDKIKTEFPDMVWSGMDWIDLGQDGDR
jgi:hypothetical protein